MKIDVKGVIVSDDDKWIYDWFEIQATSPADILGAIEEAKGESLEVTINSGGGDVYAGSEIYTALMEYSGRVTTKIVGLAASAASVIAMAGDKVLISPTAQIMIHNVSSIVGGDYRDHQHEAGVLKNYNQSIANAYILKSGLDREELLNLMNKETWFNAQQALEKKLVDEIMFHDSGQPKLVAGLGAYQTLPQEVIAKMRNELQERREKKGKQNDNPPEAERTPKAPLSLLQKKLGLQGRVFIQ